MDRLLDGIRREMPGINIVEDWVLDTSKPARKPTKHESTLLTWLNNSPVGSWPVGKVKGILGIPPATWSRLAAKLKDRSSALHKGMAEAGFEYVVERRGKTTQARLQKVIEWS
jgi:hypothetical protein